ncbi:MAG TPA: hypothetical protein DD735_01055, partial [Clostridiales bacterium]|nr:hypothetical protein [Clostridiales bacterium]
MSRRGRKDQKRVAPIYIFILIWLLNGFWGSLYTLTGLLIAVGMSIGAGILIGSLIRKKDAKGQPAAEFTPRPEPEAKPEKSYGPEVDAIIAEGKVAMKEMGRLYASIKDPAIRTKINELMRISDKIVQDAIQDPADVPQI